MRFPLRREASPCYCAAFDERLRAAREFTAEMALWPTPLEVMREAWGQIPEVLPEEPPARRRFRPFGQLYARQDIPAPGWRLSTWPGIDE